MATTLELLLLQQILLCLVAPSTVISHHGQLGQGSYHSNLSPSPSAPCLPGWGVTLVGPPSLTKMWREEMEEEEREEAMLVVALMR